jgi:large subunit ribosomal protein L13
MLLHLKACACFGLVIPTFRFRLKFGLIPSRSWCYWQQMPLASSTRTLIISTRILVKTMNKTYLPPQDSIERNWYVVDATDQRLGRLASEIAMVLRGKNKPSYTPHLDTGDFVIVINAEKVAVTGKKSSQKLYRRHSGRPGGMKTETFNQLQARLPERIVEQAVKGMLPKNTLGRQLFTKLKVYAGPDHPHQAQTPEVLDVKTIPGGK